LAWQIAGFCGIFGGSVACRLSETKCQDQNYGELSGDSPSAFPALRV
jgi:hypothetical protein